MKMIKCGFCKQECRNNEAWKRHLYFNHPEKLTKTQKEDIENEYGLKNEVD